MPKENYLVGLLMAFVSGACLRGAVEAAWYRQENELVFGLIFAVIFGATAIIVVTFARKQ